MNGITTANILAFLGHTKHENTTIVVSTPVIAGLEAIVIGFRWLELT